MIQVGVQSSLSTPESVSLFTNISGKNRLDFILSYGIYYFKYFTISPNSSFNISAILPFIDYHSIVEGARWCNKPSTTTIPVVPTTTIPTSTTTEQCLNLNKFGYGECNEPWVKDTETEAYRKDRTLNSCGI